MITPAVVAMIGPINGATIMAPMTVAVESDSTPYVAITVANSNSAKKFVIRRFVDGPSMNIFSSNAAT